jgi:hypothetical protein
MSVMSEHKRSDLRDAARAVARAAEDLGIAFDEQAQQLPGLERAPLTRAA